nr:NADH dehydrogenase subunit 4 [Procecidochares utilis]
MLKFIIMLLFIIPICFKKKIWWMVQILLFIMMFLFIILNFCSNFFLKVTYFLGMDLLSYNLILLSVWICILSIYASLLIYKKNNYENFFLFNIMILLFFLIMTFSSMNLFMFYLFFEMSLIPTLFLILGWGYQPERLQAGIYLLFYTLLVSLPMLISIFFLYYNSISLSYNFLLNCYFNYDMFYLSLILSFLVKMPMFLVHLWLPKAHVEAPVSGSMILAGIMLKLGGYGMLRVLPFLQIMMNKYSYIFISISLIGGILISLVCLRQIDLKSLIAYSSVAHMSIMLSGMLTMNYWGLCGSYILMISHGLCSSGLFCLANMMYERLSSRSLLINKGLLNFMPSLTLWWFLLCICNMAAPPSLNLLGEIFLFNSIISWSWLSMISLSFLSFFSASYSLYLYSYTQHGKIYSGIYSFSVGKIREFFLLFFHWFPLNLLILKSDVFMIWI